MTKVPRKIMYQKYIILQTFQLLNSDIRGQHLKNNGIFNHKVTLLVTFQRLYHPSRNPPPVRY